MAVVHFSNEFAVRERCNDASHRLLRVFHYMPHVGVNYIEAVVRYNPFEFDRSSLTGSNLRFEVSDVLIGVSGGPRSRCHDCPGFFF